jgi:D-alanyl-D-alanine carboxypeptidase/D-alanyl-D-alanine carboxypeptidase (penicillin-binding protein 5/6)
MIAVTIDSPDDWNDHTKLLDYGFANYRRVELCPADYQFCLPVVGGKEPYVMLGVEQAVSITLPVGAGVIEQTVECPRHVFAPVKQGEICGRMHFWCDTNNDGIWEIVGDVPLVAQCDAPQFLPRLSLWQRFLLWLRGLFS